jgi:hypothetical protein
MNYTSTKVPLWRTDCESFRRTGRSFELRDVTTAEHWAYVKDLTHRFDLVEKIALTTVTFTQKP